MDPTLRLRNLINGYQVTQALHVAATLGISDLLAAGPREAADLAQATGTHAPTLARLMRALASVDVYASDAEGRYANTALGEALRSDVEGSLGGWAAFVGRPYYWQSWAGLEESVRTGENAFAAVHGQPVWEFRRQHPDEQEIFDAAMTSMSGSVATGVVEAYDFGRYGTVVDIGGGAGKLLAAILQRYPDVRGVLFDQPDVVAGAAPLLSAAGISDRCTTVGGSFFEAVPAGGDAYLMKAIIHDWPDAESIEILRACRRAMSDDGALLLVEQILDRGTDVVRTAFSDLNMLVGPGGQERTIGEYDALLHAGGFSLTGVADTGTAVYVIEAAPAR